MTIAAPTIVRPLLWRVVRRCSVPLAANLVLFALFGSRDLSSAMDVRIAELREVLVFLPFAISAWTVARWEEDALPYGQAVINAWSGTTIALLGTALIEIATDLVRSHDLELGAMLMGYALFGLLPIAIATAVCRTLLRRRMTAPAD